MKKHSNPELKRVINQQAHMLPAQLFSEICRKLEQKARALLQEGQSLEETIRAIQLAGLRNDTTTPCNASASLQAPPQASLI